MIAKNHGFKLEFRKFSKFASWIAPALVAAAISGCDSGAAGSASPSSEAAVSTVSTPTTTAATTSNSTPAPTGTSLTGESCVSSDANKLCLAIHFVSYTDSSGAPVASATQAATILHTMNQLWSQCNIGFQIEKYEAVDPAKNGLDFGANSQNQLDQIRQAYAQPSNQLLAVTTGPWGTAVNAWTNMPGDAVYGAIMEASIVDYGGGIIYAHEFGHYLGLDHVSDSSDLMNAIISTDSTKLDSTQCQAARDTANQYWAAMLRK